MKFIIKTTIVILGLLSFNVCFAQNQGVNNNWLMGYASWGGFPPCAPSWIAGQPFDLGDSTANSCVDIAVVRDRFGNAVVVFGEGQSRAIALGCGSLHRDDHAHHWSQ